MVELAQLFWQISVVMSVVVVLQLLLNRVMSGLYQAKWRYYIWLIIICGLIIPVRPEGLALPQLTLPPVVAVDLNVAATNLIVPSHSTASEGDGQAVAAKVGDSSESSPISWQAWLAGVWLLGAIGYLSYHGWRYRQFIALVKRWSYPATDPLLLQLVSRVKADFGLEHNRIGLSLCRFEISPMLVGFVRPTILLPERLVADDELELVLRHELVHYQHKDIWIKALTLVAVALHWWNPVVHLLAATMRADCEQACDETLLNDCDLAKRRVYGETIISFIGRQGYQPVLSTYFYGGKNDMEKRLTTIMDLRKKKNSLAVLLAVFVVSITLLSGNLFVSAKAVVTVDQAQQIALDKTGGGTILKIKQDYEAGRTVYEVDIIKDNSRYELEIDAVSGEIISYKQKQARNTESNLTKGTLITAEQAKQIALDRAGGGEIYKFELDHKHGRNVYEIDLVNAETRYEVDVDAQTGTVIGYKEKPVSQVSFKLSDAVKMSLEQAKELAVNKVGGGSVLKAELDYEHGRPVYEVEVIKANIRYEFEIDAQTAEIVGYEEKAVNKYAAANNDSMLSLAQAQEIAIAKAGGGTIVKSKIDYEKGYKIYEFTIINQQHKHEVEIRANDGQIIEYEVERI